MASSPKRLVRLVARALLDFAFAYLQGMLPDRFARIVHHLAERDSETSWIEFKHNNEDPNMIGERISALANSATLHGEARGYMVWGIRDSDHAIVGTEFNYRTARKGAEELNNWLYRQMSPPVAFRWIDGYVDGQKIVLLEIPAATHLVVKFANSAYIRSGSYTFPLMKYPDMERDLWGRLSSLSFERGVCVSGLTIRQVFDLLDVGAFFELDRLRRSPRDEHAISHLVEAHIVVARNDGDYDLTNLGAILFAYRLADVGLDRKAIRIVHYAGRDRVNTVNEFPSLRGYATGFSSVLTQINRLLPTRESIVKGIRQNVSQYPEIAIRELVANALIHQDFTITGAGPMVEIFSDRVEISNPGSPLIALDRFIDKLQSRNERLAVLMRRLGVCEERGSGIDKTILAIEGAQLPPPVFRTDDQLTRVVLFSARPWDMMTMEDRVRGAYQHASIQYVSHDYLTNGSLRARFALGDRQSSAVSRVINEAVARNRIVKVDGAAGRKLARYWPYFAEI